MASSSDQPNGVCPITSLLYPGMPRLESAQPGITASKVPRSRMATPSPSSNHSACRRAGLQRRPAARVLGAGRRA